MNSALSAQPETGAHDNVVRMPIPFRPEEVSAELARLRGENFALRMKNRHLEQAVIALGDINRYHASNALGRHATESEAILHFIEKGGADDFRNSHPAPG